MCCNIIELHKKNGKANNKNIREVKSESHLQKFNDAVDFITKKFGKYEQEREEREEIINNLMKMLLN